MKDEPTVFKTSDPRVLESFTKAKDAHAEWRKAIHEFTKSVHPEAGPMVGTTWGVDNFDGISLVDPIPDGWRVMKQKRGADFLVPKRSVKAGKAAGAQLDALRKAPDVRASLLGMPNLVWHGMGSTSPGVDDRLEDGVLYVTWSTDPIKADKGFSNTAELDLDIWERVKLSEFYALKEAKEQVSA